MVLLESGANCPCAPFLQVRQKGQRPPPVHHQCGGCSKTTVNDGISLKYCERCMLAGYCSRECQKRDWALHKTRCSGDIDGQRALKLSEKLITSELANIYLTLAIGHEFQMLQIPLEERFKIARGPIQAELEMVIEPEDVKELVSLHREREAWAYKRVRGVAQFSALRKSPIDSHPPLEGFNGRERFLALREEMDAKGRQDSPIVLLRILRNSKTVGVYTIPVQYHILYLMEMAKLGFKKPIHAVPVDQNTTAAAYFDSSEESPLRAPSRTNSLLNHLNEHLRFDKETFGHLTTPITASDKDVLLQGLCTVTPESLKPSSYFFFWKTVREPIYKDVRAQIALD